MRKRVSAILIGLAVVAILIYGTLKVFKTEVAPVAVSPVLIGDIENTVTATGTVSPKSYVDVGAQVSGQITDVFVEVGDIVKKGDLLAKIDTTVLETKVESSKAELLFQKAQLKDKEAKLSLAKLAYERQKELLSAFATSQESYENAEATLLSAEANIDMTKAQIIQIESSLKENEANLKYAKIYAPMSGTISSVSVKKGQTLNANLNTPTILQIADLSTVSVAADVSEADVTKLKKGMGVYFKTLGSQNTWHTNLSKIEPTPNVTNNVVLYKAIFDVNNTSGELMNSMTTQVFFVLSSSKNTTLIPITAISKKDNANASVMLRQKDGTFIAKDIQTGVSNRVQIEVVSGLEKGDAIASNFADNTKVQQNSGDKPKVPLGMMR